MKNNKGFAISLMLYAMILLIVTIFYIVLAIVKNRFTYSESMVNNVIEFLDEHDTSMGHGDKTGPLIVFNPPSTGFKSAGIVFVTIFDDNDGEGLNEDSIIIKINNTVVYSKTVNATQYILSKNSNTERTYIQFKIQLPTSNSTLYVSVKDKQGNFAQTLPRSTDSNGVTYSYQKYISTENGPTCTIDDKSPKKAIMKIVNGKPVVDHYESVKNKTVNMNEDIYYDIICTGNNGIDAFLTRDDFTTKENTLNDIIYVKNIIITNSINKTKITIQAGTYYPASTPGCSELSTLKLKDGYGVKDSIGNLASGLNFNNHKVKVCLTLNG